MSISSSRRFLCRSDRELHFAYNICCSSVSSRGLPSAKNCARVIPNAAHTASKVGNVGALFLLNIFVTVEWDRPDSFACPAALRHHVFDSALCVHIITYLSVTIIVLEMVL